MKPLTRESWLEAHPYLRPVARVCAEVEKALDAVAGEPAPAAAFASYAGDFRAGVPLFQSANAAVDLEPAGRAVASLVRKLVAEATVERLKAEAAALDAQISGGPGEPRRAAGWLLGAEEAFAPVSPGLLRYLGWTALRRHLSAVLAAFDRWRDEDLWLRRDCPACGSRPAMAQLEGVDPGRERFLSCGRCGTRWRYRRTQCPFCENDPQRLSIVAVEGEEGLRIDYCEACKGYLKTYAGQGGEALLLADWTSLHLDVVAHDRGLERMADSLFDLDSAMAG